MKEAPAASKSNAPALSPVIQFGGVLQRKCACGTHTIGGGACDECKEGRKLQRRQARGNEQSGAQAEAPAIVHDVLRSPGQPLDANARNFMESRFAHDFSRVRVHTDVRAAESAHAVSALAYTVGSDVVFGAGQYAPQTREGRKLIAHELTHTVQQSSLAALQRESLTISSANDAGELEAERAAAQIDSATPQQKLSVMQPLLQRQPKPAQPAQGGAPAKQGKGAPKQPLCPSVGTSDSRADLRQAACADKPPAGTPEDCAFRPEQEKLLSVATVEAADYVLRADHIINNCRGGRDFAAGLAKKLFTDEVSIERVVEVIGRLKPFLSGHGVKFQGRTCADKECQSMTTVAYVKAAATLPIFLCPAAFHDPQGLGKTILHESLHWAGIVAKGEAYCESKVDCGTGCGSSDLADAWMHYLVCIGEAMPRLPRCDFRDKILDTVKDID